MPSHIPVPYDSARLQTIILIVSDDDVFIKSINIKQHFHTHLNNNCIFQICHFYFIENEENVSKLSS